MPVILTLVLIPSCVGRPSGTSADASGNISQPSAMPSAIVSRPPSYFAQFAGSWYAHSASLVIDVDGVGSLSWRSYRECEERSAPCDRFTEDGIEYEPSRMAFRLTEIKDNQSSGMVERSNDPDFREGSTISVVRRDDDHLVIEHVKAADGEFDWVFCSPNANDCGA